MTFDEESRKIVVMTPSVINISTTSEILIMSLFSVTGSRGNGGEVPAKWTNPA